MVHCLVTWLLDKGWVSFLSGRNEGLIIVLRHSLVDALKYWVALIDLRRIFTLRLCVINFLWVRKRP